MTFPGKFRGLRTSNGLSQVALGEILNIYSMSISRWERAEAIRLTEEELIGGFVTVKKNTYYIVLNRKDEDSKPDRFGFLRSKDDYLELYKAPLGCSNVFNFAID